MVSIANMERRIERTNDASVDNRVLRHGAGPEQIRVECNVVAANDLVAAGVGCSQAFVKPLGLTNKSVPFRECEHWKLIVRRGVLLELHQQVAECCHASIAFSSASPFVISSSSASMSAMISSGGQCSVPS